MVRVLSFVNEISSTSIPVEIVEHIARTTDVAVTIVSFYTPDTLDPDLEELTSEVETLDATGRFDYRAWRRLDSMLSTGTYDIFHTHQNFSGSVGRALAARHDVEVVDTEHNDHAHFSLLQNLVNAPTLPLADAVVANSNSTAASFRWYETILLADAKQHVIYNGINISRIDKAVKRAAPVDLPDGPRVVTVGTLTDQKRQETLIRALPQLLDSVPGVSLIIVGAGPRREALEQIALREGVADHVVFTGYLPTREDVYRTMAAADVFAIASQYEGFCVAAVEAMACGLPVVVSDIDVLQEVVGSQGLFAPAGDSEAFARKITQLLTDDTQRTERARKLAERAREQYPLDRTAREYVRLYNQLAQSAD